MLFATTDPMLVAKKSFAQFFAGYPALSANQPLPFVA
jgi:hypothetical protein